MMSEVRVSPSSSSSSSSNGADEEATRAPRRSPVLPRAAVCRNLFGSPERGEVEKEVKETLAALAEDCKRRWNFDFEAERPLRGRYEWEAMDATTVAGVYRTRPSANKNGGNHNNHNHNNHLGPVSNDGSDPRGAAESRTARSTRPTPRGAVDRTGGGGGHAGSDSFTATFTTTTAATTTTTTTTTTTANNNTNNTGGNNEREDPFGTKGGDLPDESRGEEDGRGSGKGSPSTAADAAAASGGAAGGGGGSPAASPGRARGDGTSAGVEATNGSHSPSGSHGRTRETPEACHRQKRGSAPLTEYFPKRKKSDGSPPHPPDL